MNPVFGRLLREARSLARAWTARRARGSDRALQPATFTAARYSGPEGTRDYKLFVPAGDARLARPLVVMLHGCGQDPDDFALGTRMNEHAQEHGVVVLYPAQAQRSNRYRCWNWFEPADQQRDGGEPALLAGLTRHVMALHAIDATRVHVAGLSAGAAMAHILAREYPDLYASAGVHSGVPHGAAHDVSSAYAAMQGHRHGGLPAALAWWLPSSRPAVPAPRARADRPSAPTIVFHGDADDTVHPRNGDDVIATALQDVGRPVSASTTRMEAAGRTVTRTVHRHVDASARAPSIAEHWVIHGGGHAWSGGSARGSHADARGPDASREMLRFFAEHPRPTPAEPRRLALPALRLGRERAAPLATPR